MNSTQCKEFLVWLSSRLQLKYNEDPTVIEKIQYIIQNKKLIDDHIDIKFINGLCNKHYPGFDFDRSEDLKIGYVNSEKKEIYSLVSSIVLDTINAQS